MPGIYIVKRSEMAVIFSASGEKNGPATWRPDCPDITRHTDARKTLLKSIFVKPSHVDPFHLDGLRLEVSAYPIYVTAAATAKLTAWWKNGSFELSVYVNPADSAPAIIPKLREEL